MISILLKILRLKVFFSDNKTSCLLLSLYFDLLALLIELENKIKLENKISTLISKLALKVYVVIKMKFSNSRLKLFNT